MFGDLSDTLQPITVPLCLSGRPRLGRTEWNGAWPGRLCVYQKGRQLGQRQKCRSGNSPVVVTLSFAKASRQEIVSKVRPGASGRMPQAAGAQTVRTIGRDTQYETGMKRLENATVDKFALDCVHSVRGTEEFRKLSLGFILPEADPSLISPWNRRYEIGSWAEKPLPANLAPAQQGPLHATYGILG